MKTLDRIKNHKDILIKALIAILCSVQLTITQILSTAQVIKTYHEIERSPLMYALGLLLLFLICFTVALFSKRTILTLGLLSVVLNFLVVINYYEIQLHGTVLTFQDIKNISTAVRVLKNYHITITPTLAKIIFSLAVMLLVLAAFYSKGISLKEDRKAAVIPALVFVLISYSLFFSPLNIVKSLDCWSWEIRYYEDSMVVGVLENLSKATMWLIEPEGYDIAEIEGITSLPSESEKCPDIIMVLDETWYDFDHLIDFNTDVSYMENYDSLDAIKGYATVPMIGGGTNASEYELLTSNSMTLLNTYTPFNDLNLQNSKSIAEYLKKLGYSTMAAHSEPSGNYHRGSAWPALGFNVTYFDTDFYNLDYYGDRYSASDSSLFQNFTRFYEAMPENQPRFAYLLTIQNHGGWDRNSSDMDTVHIQNDNGLTEYEQQINEYLTCMQQTDSFIGEMVDYFSQVDRDVVVYMVGDHGPSLLKEWDLGDSVEINLKQRQVPYFIWSNFGVDDSGFPENHTIDMCALTPVALKAANMSLSPYYAQLLKLSAYAQCITGLNYVGKNNDGLSYADKNGQLQDVYGETYEAELVRHYFYMEYNRLQKNGND